MAKFELPIYDPTTGDVQRVCQRNFMPVDLYIRFEKFAEKNVNGKEMDDVAFFAKLWELFREVFPDLTEQEFRNQVDTAQVLCIYTDVILKSAQLSDGDSKNR